MKNTITLTLCLAILSGMAHAEVRVCVDKNGKKTFSDASCEQRGMQPATADFPVASAQNNQTVYILTAPESSAHANVESALPAAKPLTPAKREKRISTWGADVPLKGLPFFLIASMPVIASLFLGYQIFLYIRARYRGLKSDRS